jgi:ubiquinone/menaquinone biosynthesis C-methylase UbiE
MAKLNRKYESLVADRKRELFGNLRGKVVEIGPGTGPNLRYYPEGVQWIGVEPNPFMHPYLRKQAQALGLNVDLRNGFAQRLAIEDNSADAVVSTLVLCSLADVESALREILRVLRPGGVFLFLEHVAAPHGSRLRRLQRALRPIWSKLGDGCRPERETWTSIERAGFENTNIEHFRVPVPVVGPHIIGTAKRGVS